MEPNFGAAPTLRASAAPTCNHQRLQHPTDQRPPCARGPTYSAGCILTCIAVFGEWGQRRLDTAVTGLPRHVTYWQQLSRKVPKCVRFGSSTGLHAVRLVIDTGSDRHLPRLG